MYLRLYIQLQSIPRYDPDHRSISHQWRESWGLLKNSPVTLIWMCVFFFQNGMQIFTRIAVYWEKPIFGEFFEYSLINSNLWETKYHGGPPLGIKWKSSFSLALSCSRTRVYTADMLQSLSEELEYSYINFLPMDWGNYDAKGNVGTPEATFVHQNSNPK